MNSLSSGSGKSDVFLGAAEWMVALRHQTVSPVKDEKEISVDDDHLSSNSASCFDEHSTETRSESPSSIDESCNLNRTSSRSRKRKSFLDDSFDSLCGDVMKKASRRKQPSNRVQSSRESSHFGRRDEVWLSEIKRRCNLISNSVEWDRRLRKVDHDISKISLRGVYRSRLPPSKKSNSTSMRYRACFYLDYHQIYLGAFDTPLEAAVAYDYAVSFMRPFEIGMTSSVTGGKIIDINFPRSYSDCRVEPPIDEWPEHVLQHSNFQLAMGVRDYDAISGLASMTSNHETCSLVESHSVEFVEETRSETVM